MTKFSILLQHLGFTLGYQDINGFFIVRYSEIALDGCVILIGFDTMRCPSHIYLVQCGVVGAEPRYDEGNSFTSGLGESMNM